MKKYLTFLLFIMCFASFEAKAQDGKTQNGSKSIIKFEYQEVCGDPRRESTAYIFKVGLVEKINEDNSLVIKIERKKKTVKLAGVSPKTNKKEINSFLSDNLLKDTVEVLFLPRDLDKKSFYAIIKNGRVSVSRQLIEKGIAKFENNADYTIVGYTSCVYRQVEKEAKEKKLGVWSKSKID